MFTKKPSQFTLDLFDETKDYMLKKNTKLVLSGTLKKPISMNEITYYGILMTFEGIHAYNGFIYKDSTLKKKYYPNLDKDYLLPKKSSIMFLELNDEYLVDSFSIYDKKTDTYKDIFIHNPQEEL